MKAKVGGLRNIGSIGSIGNIGSLNGKQKTTPLGKVNTANKMNGAKEHMNQALRISDIGKHIV